MHQRISRKILIYFLFLVLLTSISNKNILQINLFKLKNLEIKGLDENELLYLSKKINSLNIKNIYLFNEEILKKTLDSYSLIEKYFVFKKYPSSLRISIYKTNLIANLIVNGENYFVGTNGKLIKSSLENYNLPFIFGNPTNKDILKFYNAVLNSPFKFKEFKNLFFYKSGRWDIETLNGQIIKLPRENVSNTLNRVFYLLTDNNMIDVRVTNQTIFYDK